MSCRTGGRTPGSVFAAVSVQLILLVLAGLGALANSKAANAQATCPAGQYCSAPIVGGWRYWVGDVGFGGAINQWFNSEADARAAIVGYFIPASSWCSMSLSATTPDVYLGFGNYPQYYGGIDVAHSTGLTYNIVSYKSDVPPCTQQWSTHFGYEHRRDVFCLPQYTLQTVNGVAYCTRPKAEWDPAKICGKCTQGQVIRGNPIDIGTGNKFLEVSDYRTAGTSPLEFVRYYNSWDAHFWRNGQLGWEWRPLGFGWAATYFQKIRFFATPNFVTAWAYRPDGRVLAFDRSGGTFVPHEDVNERLVRLYDGAGNPSGWKLTTPEDETELYDSQGRLLSITLRSGVVRTVSYDASGFAKDVTDSFGNALSFTYSNSARRQLVAVVTPSGDTISFGYSSSGDLVSVTYPDGKQVSYGYDSNSHMTSRQDETATTVASYGYFPWGAAFSTELAGGVEKYTISFSNNTRSVTDSRGTVQTFVLNWPLGVPRVASVLQPSSAGNGVVTASTTRDANDNPTLETDFNGNKTSRAFDPSRNLEIARTEADGTPRARTITTQWHSTFRLPTLITEPNRTVAFTYDSAGNQLSKTITDTTATPNASRTWTYTYDALGRMLTADGPRTDVSDVTTYTYYTCTTGYECGQLHTVTDALNHTTTFNTYNAHGQPLTITDANGVVTTLVYDLRQRLTSRTVGAEQTTSDYWPTGLLKKVTLPDRSFLSFIYDAAHRLTEINDAAGNRVVYTLDAMSNRTTENVYDSSGALARTHSRVFNALNQLWKDLTASGAAAQQTVFGYDDNGNQTTVDAPLSRRSSVQYDELDRRKQATDAQGGVTQYAYDANDNLATVTDPRNLQTTYAHDGFGNLTQQLSPDTGATANAFDEGGNLKSATDASGKKGAYIYDALNRVTQVAYRDQLLNYTYDFGANAIGRLSGAGDAAHSLSWSYDERGRVTSKTQTIGSISKTVRYAYTDGRLASMMLPSGQAVTYSYSNGRIVRISLGGTIILNDVLYEPFGPVRQWTWGNASISARTYDTDGKVSQIDSAGLRVYTYDDAFRITGIRDAINGADGWTYSYDSMDRLTGASSAAIAQGFTYDLDGNRLTQSGTTSKTLAYASTSNRLASVDGSVHKLYTFDAAGHVTSDGPIKYGYNEAGRMISATVAGKKTSYWLNALGQRVKKSNASATTYFVYDEAGRLIGEYGSSGNLVQEIVWLDNIPVASLRRRSGGGIDVFYIHTDHLNTPRKITRSTDNAIVWRWDSDPFGTTPPNENPNGLGKFVFNLRFAGQYFDQETQLNYNYFRDYDPQTGRYVESDPIGLDGGSFSTYAYVGENPMAFVDPLGLGPDDSCGTCSPGDLDCLLYGGNLCFPGKDQSLLDKFFYHGNWCGPGWTGGHQGAWDELTPGDQKTAKPPVDALDSCCRTHDVCYASCRTNNPCDKKARLKCMATCDINLASCSARFGHKWSSPLWWVMRRGKPHDAGPNDAKCSTSCERK